MRICEEIFEMTLLFHPDTSMKGIFEITERMTLADVCNHGEWILVTILGAPETILEAMAPCTMKSMMIRPQSLLGHRTVTWETIQIGKYGMGHKEIVLRLQIGDLQGPLHTVDTILWTCPSHPILIQMDHHHLTSIAEDTADAAVDVDADSEEAEDDSTWVDEDLTAEGSITRTAITPSAKMMDRIITMGRDLTIVRWRKVGSERRKLIVKRSRQ